MVALGESTLGICALIPSLIKELCDLRPVTPLLRVCIPSSFAHTARPTRVFSESVPGVQAASTLQTLKLRYLGKIQVLNGTFC